MEHLLATSSQASGHLGTQCFLSLPCFQPCSEAQYLLVIFECLLPPNAKLMHSEIMWLSLEILKHLRAAIFTKISNIFYLKEDESVHFK